MAVIAAGAWGYYQKGELRTTPLEPHQPQQNSSYSQMDEATIAQTAHRFRCDGRQYCSQMTSWEEAKYFVRNCPNTKMDGDHDGIPCENDSRF
jgi:hypothetical protein